MRHILSDILVHDIIPKDVPGFYDTTEFEMVLALEGNIVLKEPIHNHAAKMTHDFTIGPDHGWNYNSKDFTPIEINKAITALINELIKIKPQEKAMNFLDAYNKSCDYLKKYDLFVGHLLISENTFNKTNELLCSLLKYKSDHEILSLIKYDSIIYDMERRLIKSDIPDNLLVILPEPEYFGCLSIHKEDCKFSLFADSKYFQVFEIK